MTRLVEIHILQNHSPANMNRDDMGAPKSCIFGGTQRLRISSQCLKRAARTSEAFREALLDEKLAERTRAFKPWILERLEARKEMINSLQLEATDIGPLADAISAYIKGKQESSGSSAGEDDGGTDSDADDASSSGGDVADLRKQPLVFLGEHELDALVDSVLSKANADELRKSLRKKKKGSAAPALPDDLVKLLKPISLPCAPVALFGRMTTSNAFQAADAAVCVAHAISTHRATLEVDYWTAMGDRKEEARADAGSDHIGERQFASATFYKYASVDLDQLVSNLGGSRELAEKALRAFLKGLVMSYPGGMQTSMGHHNPPSAILVELKSRKVPTNYANAFVRPLAVTEARDQVETSIDALKSFAESMHASWVAPDRPSAWWRYDGDVQCETFIEEQVKHAMQAGVSANAS